MKKRKCEKRKRSHIDKFRKFWHKLSRSERERLWWLLTALRGPDIPGYGAVKMYVTGRIRHELFGYDLENVVSTSKECSDKLFPEVEYNRQIAELGKQSIHFLCHIRQATRPVCGLSNVQNIYDSVQREIDKSERQFRVG